MAMAAPSDNRVGTLSSDGTPGQGPGVVRVAPHALNRDKLTKNLLADARKNLPHVAVSVKDTGANVNLVCSPGFFEAVA